MLHGRDHYIQSATAPAGFASPPVRMGTKVSDIIVSTLPAGPRWWLSSTPHVRNSQDIFRPLFDLTIRTDASLLGWREPAMQRRPGDAGAWRRQNNTSTEIQSSLSRFEGIPERTHTAATLESEPPFFTSHPSRHSVIISVPPSLGTVVLPTDPRFKGDSPQLTGSVECGSRCSFKRIQHSYRVDATTGCLLGHSTSRICSGNRGIGVVFKPSAASLCRD